MVDLARKNLRQIQAETAVTWTGRACAARYLRHDADAIEYAHEAIEHAALSGDAALLEAVRAQLRVYGVPL